MLPTSRLFISMPEETNSTIENIPNPTSAAKSAKKGFNPLRTLLNLFFWALIIGAIVGIFGLVVYFTKDILGIESFWGALLAFPVMGILIFFTLAANGDADSGFWLAVALTIGGFVFWGILQIFGGLGIGVITAVLVLACAFAVDLTDKEERADLGKEIAKSAAEDAAKEAQEATEHKAKFEAKLAQLSGIQLAWQSNGAATTLQTREAAPVATLQETGNNEWSIDFTDGIRYQVSNSTLQFVFRETNSEQPVLTYHRSIISSDEKIELATGRTLGLKRQQSKMLLEKALLAWELHEGETVLLRLEENKGGGQIVLAENFSISSESKEVYLLSLAGILAIKTFRANVGAAGSVDSTHL